MNKNSTQERIRNFESKNSAYFKILSALTANLQRAGGCIAVQHYNHHHKRVVSGFLSVSFYLADIFKIRVPVTFFLKPRRQQLRLQPVTLNQF